MSGDKGKAGDGIKWATAIITSPRPGPTLLPKALASFREAGFARPHICDDREHKLGAYGNWRAALAKALDESKGDADYVLIAEDDIEMSAGLRDYLELYPPPEGVVSLYSAAPNDPSDSVFGWLPIKAPNRSYGALAYILRPQLARDFLKSAPFTDRPNGTDHAVGTWCKNNGVTYYVHAPSFVVHRGDQSTLPAAGIDENRQCRRWVISIGIRRDQQSGRSKVIADVLDLETNQSRLESVTRGA